MDEKTAFPPHRAAVPKKVVPVGEQTVFPETPHGYAVGTPRRGPGRPAGARNKRKALEPAEALMSASGKTVGLARAIQIITGFKPRELRAAATIVEVLEPLPARHQAAILRLMQELLG